MAEDRKTGVLLTAFGGPDSLDAVGPFMTNLMGREPSPELLERVRRRYLAIGGRSPLPDVTREIASGLQTELSAALEVVPVRVGMRYWRPFIADAVAELVAEGCERVITVSLSPFETAVASGAYDEAVREAAQAHPGVEIVPAPPYRDLESFIQLLARLAAVALHEAPKTGKRLLVFTAHSLPVAEAGEEYVKQLRTAVDGIVGQLSLSPGKSIDVAGQEAYGSMGEFPWLFAYQSKGERPGAWLGPDIGDVLDWAEAQGFGVFVVSPFAFLTDHLETLYDLDIVLAGRALEKDMEFVRAPVPNEHKDMVDVLAETVRPLL